MNNRIGKLRDLLSLNEIDALFISQPENRYYLSGFSGSYGYLLITDSHTRLATDFRYMEQVRNESADFEITEIKGKMSEWLPGFLDTGISKIGVEASDMNVNTFKLMSKIIRNEGSDIQLIPVENVVEQLRAIKEHEEIHLIQQAAAIADTAFRDVISGITEGITEAELAWRLERHMREHESGAMPFEIIVAAGPNSALPHYQPGNRRIKKNEPIVIDMGARYEHYCSDMTRTICLGEPDDTFRKIYNIVLEAQKNALINIKSGIDGVKADALARDIIKQEGYADKFGHGLGHGVGLSVHDTFPRLSPLAPAMPLSDGMVFSVEPGIYIPGWGGVRIEDTVVLENGKVKPLTLAEKLKV